MADLPAGTVTLVFSDIEGSTALLSRLGSEYAAALDAQRELMRHAWSDHGGLELGTEGDSFYVVFDAAPQAVRAASAAQRALAGHAWPRGETLRVRVGVHTGSPAVHGDAYVGMDVHRAARVAAAAHGGQVVLSETTAALVAAQLPEGTSLLDLGRHRLKDMPLPERLYQLNIDGLGSDFPPLRTVGSTSRLPETPTILFGRETEIDAVADLVASGVTRLVTLTGPGGVGKTRLSIAVARRLWRTVMDDVYYVPLAPATAISSAWSLVAESLGLPAERRSASDVIAACTDLRALFVLDNLEQLADADLLVAELLSASPASCVVVSSRRPLHLPAEHEFPVPPLDVPQGDQLAAAAASPAVGMFVQHAQRVRPGFELTADNAADIAALCRRLDGLPLGLALTAARTKLLSPSALLGRLGSALDVSASTSRGPDRHRTLRAAIAWSYELLDERSKCVFRRLGVFEGGADLAAVAYVTQVEGDPLEVTSDLLDASLVGVEDDLAGEPRVLLLETIRGYALDVLAESGELEESRDRHAQHFLSVARELVPLLEADRYLLAKARLGAELANLRAALDWTLPREEPSTMTAERRICGIELCGQVGAVWSDARAYLELEGLHWTRRAVERDHRGDSRARTQCLKQLSIRVSREGDYEKAHELAVRAVEMSRRLDDSRLLIDVLCLQATLESQRGELESARARFDEALGLARVLGDSSTLHGVLVDRAILVEAQDGSLRALPLKREALEVALETGNPYAVAIDHHNIACSLRLLGRHDEALEEMRSVVPEALRLDLPSALMYLAEDFAAVLAEHGRASLTAELLGAADASHARLHEVRVAAQEAEIAEPIARARAALDGDEWDAAYAAGYQAPIQEVLRQTLRTLG